MTAKRRICVTDPVKVVITNYDENKVEFFPVSNNPNDENAGTRDLLFTREVFIDRSDFEEVPPPKFFRMKPGGEVRLMGAYIVKCNEVIKDENGKVVELHCTADLESGNGNPVDGRKVKGTIHWISAQNAKEVTLMLYDKLFTIENLSDIPEDKTYNDYLNPGSLVKVEKALVEKSLDDAENGEKFQFVRNGYYCKDSKYENTFNRIVGLKDSYPKK
jgi:glutaminyl-tRNA synthetase